MNAQQTTTILERLDAISAQVAYLAERQRAQEELVAELMPVARAALTDAIGRLDQLDRKGYFAFAEQLVQVGQRIVEGFSPDDVRQLGDAVVGILDAVRTLTQPEVLHVVTDAAEAVQSDDVKPLGLFGMVRATRNDDVQKGMALMVEVMRRIGKGANAMAGRHRDHGDRKQALGRLLGPRRSRKVLGVERPRLPAPAPARATAPAAAPAAAAACPAPGPAEPGAVIDGIAYTAEGYLVDSQAWSRTLASALAESQAIHLTDAHWSVIEAARTDFASTGVSPNIRRLTQVGEVATRDLYNLFPRAPARTIARIAGLPKPAGCL